MRIARVDDELRDTFSLIIQVRPRQDSNLRSRLRRAVLYPLSYGGFRLHEVTSAGGVVSGGVTCDEDVVFGDPRTLGRLRSVVRMRVRSSYHA